MKKYLVAIFFILFMSTAFSAKAQNTERKPKQPDFFIPERTLQQMQHHQKMRYHDSLEKADVDCQRHCGNGYIYDTKRNTSSSEQIVCTQYPKNCGEFCQVSHSFRMIQDNKPYECNKITKKIPKEVDPSECKEEPFARIQVRNPTTFKKCDKGECWFPDREKTEKDDDCKNVCGECFYYDEYYNGKIVCTRHSCSCGPACSRGWQLTELLLKGSEYQCKDALFAIPAKEKPSCKSKGTIENEFLNFIEKKMLK